MASWCCRGCLFHPLHVRPRVYVIYVTLQHRSLASPAQPINFYLTLIANYYLARFFASLIDGQSAPLDLPASALIEFSSFARSLAGSWLLFSSKRAAAGRSVGVRRPDFVSPYEPGKFNLQGAQWSEKPVCVLERDAMRRDMQRGKCCLYFCTCSGSWLQRLLTISTYGAMRDLMSFDWENDKYHYRIKALLVISTLRNLCIENKRNTRWVQIILPTLALCVCRSPIGYAPVFAIQSG